MEYYIYIVTCANINSFSLTVVQTFILKRCKCRNKNIHITLMTNWLFALAVSTHIHIHIHTVKVDNNMKISDYFVFNMTLSRNNFLKSNTNFWLEAPNRKWNNCSSYYRFLCLKRSNLKISMTVILEWISIIGTMGVYFNHWIFISS